MTWQPSSRLSKTSSAIDPPPRPGVLILASYSKALTTKSSGAAKRCVGSACGRNDPNRSAELGELERVTERGDIVATVTRDARGRLLVRPDPDKDIGSECRRPRGGGRMNGVTGTPEPARWPM